MKSSNTCCDSSASEQTKNANSCCDTSTTQDPSGNTSCCDTGDELSIVELRIKNINITMDGRELIVTPEEANLVDVARKNKISLPAPCYINERKTGCCNGCVVDIEGEQKFACSSAPKEGMNVIVNTPELRALRKERLKEYQKGIKSGKLTPCSVEIKFKL